MPNQVFCSNCGAVVEGRYCKNCGTAVSQDTVPPTGAVPPVGGVPPTSGYVPPVTAQSMGMEENLAAALCYIPIVGLVFLLLDPYKRNRNVRFHAWQSLLLFAAFFVFRIALGITWLIVAAVMPYGFGAMWGLLMSLVGLAYLLGLIVLAVKAYQGTPLVVPIIGPIAQKQAG
jgi:uncharacterized membrane protein